MKSVVFCLIATRETFINTFDVLLFYPYLDKRMHRINHILMVDVTHTEPGK